MNKKQAIFKIILNTLLCYISVSVLDFVIHQLFLSESYAMTAKLWRPVEEMNMVLMQVISFISVLVFSEIYFHLINPKQGIKTGLKFGILMGVLVGASMGFGTYSVQPITTTIAWGWFLGSIFQFSIVGIITGAMFGSSSKQ